jgi:Spx/MgsR family transcriptional regulator
MITLMRKRRAAPSFLIPLGGPDANAAGLGALYGIPNCDTVKKSRAWLSERGMAHVFHDFKKQGVPEAALDTWLVTLGWEALVNCSGTTWRKLDAGVRAHVVDAVSARAALLAHPSLIKRPVVEWADGAVSVGFDKDRLAGQDLIQRPPAGCRSIAVRSA